MMLNLNVSIWHQVNFSIFDNLNILRYLSVAKSACTKRRNVETKRPKRNGRNHRNHRNDRNETTETKQPKRNDRNETAETKRPKRNGRKYKLQEKWKILIKI